jgi:hypothetical protein
MDMNKAPAQMSESFGKIGSAAAESNLIQSRCTAAFEGVQAYNKKLVEFTRENTNAAFDFVQRLYSITSPSEFIAFSVEHARAQTEVLTGQTEQLRALAQKIALASPDRLNSGAAKAAGHDA